MRAVVLDVPDKWLREREAAGLDRWDEMWEGVLHMTPPPGGPHQIFATRLGRVTGRAELVIEVRSPGDESYEKLPFYAACQVAEVLVVDPESRAFDLFRLADDSYQHAEVTSGEVIELSTVAVALATVESADGPGLRVSWVGGERTI